MEAYPENGRRNLGMGRWLLSGKVPGTIPGKRKQTEVWALQGQGVWGPEDRGICQARQGFHPPMSQPSPQETSCSHAF